MAIFKALEFDGVNSLDYGIYITGEAVYNAPERAVEMINIPGKNGALALDQGRFENIEVTYHAGCFADSQADFADKVMRFRNALASRYTYKRLTDEYHPDEYRLGLYKSGLDVDAVRYGTAGEFNIVFDCKPQRFLIDGDRAISPTEWSDLQTESGELVTIESDGSLAVKSLEVSLEPIQDLNGYSKPWVGGAGANKWDEEWELGALSATGENATSSTEIRSKKYIPVVGGQTYYLCCAVASTFNYKFYDADKNFISGAYIGRNNTLLIPNDARYMRFFMDAAYGTTYNHDIAINYPSSVTTYSPYSNICPISGHTEVDTTRAGKNLLDTSYGYDSGTMQGVTFTVNSDKSITVNGTATATAYFNLTFKGAFGTSKPMPQLAGKTVTVKCKNALANPRVNIDYFKADGTNYGGAIYSLANDNAVTRTLPSDFYSFRAFITVSAGATVDNITLYPQIELGTEVAEYEPYKGNTYTTALGRTVYGGTLDVVSGVLTLTHGFAEYDGSSDESWTGSNTRFAIIPDGVYRSGTGRGEVISNEFVYSSSATTVGTIFLLQSSGQIYVYPPVYDSLANFKSWLSSHPIQVVYPLATPQIYNVSTRLVKAIVGTNNVWSEQGPVTVEFGLDPNKLYNPTQFDAHPLLAVTGSGRVMFDDYTITLYDQDLGIIDLGDKSYSSTTGNITTGDILVDSSWVNNGDLATIGSTRLVLDTNLDMRYSHVVVDTRSGDLTIEAGASGGNKLVLTVGATNIAFNSSAVRISGTADVRIVDKRTQAISRVTVQIQLMTYTSGYRRIFATATVTPQTMTSPNITLSFSWWSIGIRNVSAYSTASALGNPTYIDCEIGEAYKYMGDKLMTLNGLIAFGNDLPSLPPGATEITKDQTITDLKITPRWWKI